MREKISPTQKVLNSTLSYGECQILKQESWDRRGCPEQSGRTPSQSSVPSGLLGHGCTKAVQTKDQGR